MWEAGAVGVEETAGGLRAAFVDVAAARAVRDRLAPDAAIETFADTFGLDASLDLLMVEHAGPFAVHPPWLNPPEDAIGIEIEPAAAFGSGSHPSTRLALSLLETVVGPDAAVADIGCGTGVLTIGAARLGARVVAVDVDPEAVEATGANAVRNGVEEAVEIRLGSVDDLPGPVDVALVNVTIDVHERLASRVRAPTVVVAGILTGQRERAIRAYDADIVAAAVEGEWAGLVLRRG